MGTLIMPATGFVGPERCQSLRRFTVLPRTIRNSWHARPVGIPTFSPANANRPALANAAHSRNWRHCNALSSMRCLTMAGGRACRPNARNALAQQDAHKAWRETSLMSLMKFKRLFIGLELPSACRSTLVTLDPCLKGLRWLPAEQLHLTLSFLGEVEVSRIDGLREAC